MVYKFEDFELDADTKTLRKQGVEIGLNGKCFKALLFLLMHRGERITREQIIRFVNDTLDESIYVNFDNNDVDKIIRALRQTLGDNSRNPRIIQTVFRSQHPDGGYKFIADLEPCSVKNNDLLNFPSEGSLSESEWVKKLNMLPDVKIYGTTDSIPEIKIDGDYKIDKKYRTEIEKCRKTLAQNDTQAVVLEVPDIDTVPLVFNAKKLRYAAVKVLRTLGNNPYVLSSNAVLVCPERNLLIVDRRSSATDTYNSKFHTLGGAFEVNRDSANFKINAMREITEESGVPSSIRHDIPILISEEISTKFIQIVFLGAVVSESELKNLTASWESEKLVKLPFDKLEEYLVNEDLYSWVPTGKAHILAWLAFGAPGCNGKATFNGKRPEELFLEVVATI